MGCIATAIGLGDADLFGQLLRVEPAVVSLRQPLGMELVQIAPQAALLLRVTRCAIQRAALAVVAVDAFAGQHLGDFVGDGVQQVERGTALLGGQTGEQAVFAQQVAHQPAAVAA